MELKMATNRTIEQTYRLKNKQEGLMINRDTGVQVAIERSGSSLQVVTIQIVRNGTISTETPQVMTAILNVVL
jgi:hypothetical protein